MRQRGESLARAGELASGHFRNLSVQAADRADLGAAGITAPAVSALTNVDFTVQVSDTVRMTVQVESDREA
jgi:hypothetical protein